MAPSVSGYALLGFAVTLGIFFFGACLVHLPKQYCQAIEKERRDIGPPWTDVTAAVDHILACTVRDLQNAAALWGNNWQLIQDGVARHRSDDNVIGMIDNAHRLALILDSLNKWHRRDSIYSLVAAIFMVVCFVASFYFGMKAELLWLPIIGVGSAALITFVLHGIVLQVIHRRGREANDIHKTLRGALE